MVVFIEYIQCVTINFRSVIVNMAHKKEMPIPHCNPFLKWSLEFAEIGTTQFSSNAAIGWLYDKPTPVLTQFFFKIFESSLL